MSAPAFTTSDRRELEQRGIPLAEARRQLDRLRHGKSFLPLARPCAVGDGIGRITPDEAPQLSRRFDRDRTRFTRFVPASGAASRMFQGLFPDEIDPDKVARLRSNLERFPFYPELSRLADGSPEALDDAELCDLLLAGGLALDNLPKGLLPLHRGRGYRRSAFAEHLHEGCAVGIGRFHFTVSPEHRELFRRHLNQVRDELAPSGPVPDVDFSVQSPTTDTIALDPHTGGPFHDADGHLLFRPAGHGALLANLENCAGDLVLIRNIDNVVPEPFGEPYRHWTRLLGGRLLELQAQVFAWLDRLDTLAGMPDREMLQGAADFLRQTFGRAASEDEGSERLARLLDRPIRVCGMVPVSGQPGGGPFWTRDALGQVTPQIIEGVQIDSDDDRQQQILAASTHFNPVNIACSLRDRHGRPYRLADFVDEDAALITAKNHSGRELLALERPGLWNGSMSGWNTHFIEMPPETFNPVKTVFDLLAPAHQVER